MSNNIANTEINTIANNQNVSVKSASAVTMANPTIAGAGTEPKVVGAAFGLKAGETSALIDGDKGVYMVKVTAVNNAPELQDYSSFANTLNTSTLSSLNTNVYNALKNEADIEDNRATFF